MGYVLREVKWHDIWRFAEILVPLQFPPGSNLACAICSELAAPL